MNNEPFAVGQVVAGTYEITGVLGTGGMGVVYEAHDQSLGRLVAIKVARIAPGALALRREAQVLAAMKSPSFPRIHHLAREGEHELLVMERLYGETLHDRLNAMRPQLMKIDDALGHLIATTRAVAEAHRAGFAQRDLKPSNIMLAGERTVLIDFGLFVPEIFASWERDVNGSPQYMAPEVILRRVRSGEGPLVDLYALGVLTFELLTGATPFGDQSVERVLLKHVTETPCDLADAREDAPRELCALVSELLSKDPSARPPCAEAVLWRLQELRDTRASRSRSMRVVAIDDDAHMGSAIKKSLESSYPRLEVQTTTDSVRAARELAASPPDVALVDLNMPGANGIEVCMTLLGLPPGVRPVVVAMSAEAEKHDVAVLRAIGVEHFVPKGDGFLASVGAILSSMRG
jgi:serine/threonine protein kinase